MFKLSATFTTALALAAGANAFFRLPCTDPLVQERVDPVISPGIAPSNHVHTVHGGSRFPELYFRDPNTKQFEAVPNGGLLIYYLNRGDADVANGGPGLKAFPEGFKMITGNPRARSKKYESGLGTQAELAERAVGWACLRYPDYPQTDGIGGFPTTDCESGFQSRLHFPSCWDGKNVDSTDHVSHTAYLDRLDNGKCPSTHPVPLIHLFYEVTWDVHGFASRWTAADGWPFVWATGDPTGYSWHGDFQNGWETAALQNAIDFCNNPNDDTGNGVVEACKYLTVIPAATANQCKITNPEVTETVSGTLAKLPGCNPIQDGPGDATLYNASNCPA
ncbi:hypothetical protein BDV93DRAFT_545387 [Ceratobasidium sp. AG-I]|nr:hypothetical protein BDV93DRAFT_545387 [Ceratobasidium sp. AG-I]